VLGVLVGLAGAYFESHVVTASTWFTDRFGVVGILAAICVSDTIISPLPPDALLIVIAKGKLAGSWAWLVPVGGFASGLGGFVGSFIGKALGVRWLGPRTRQLLDEHRPVIERYGVWAVVLGALTPVPFSVTCWLARMAGLRPARILVACLLRVPRFMLYYLFIVQADRLGSMFWP
jgi:membrane protein YqaA with SNARE-associated domain